MRLWLIGFVAALAVGSVVAAPPQSSGYTQFKGEPFFLLSDATFGSTEQARVRLEHAVGRDVK